MKQGCRSRLTLLIGVIAVLAISAGASAQSPTAQSAKAAELSRAGKYSEALPLAQAAVATLERISPNSRDFAGTLNNLAQLYGDLGQDDKAEPLFERALAIMERAVGIDSSDIAPEMNNLAALYERQGRVVQSAAGQNGRNPDPVDRRRGDHRVFGHRGAELRHCGHA